MAARMMRRILVDSARARGNQKRGGGAPRVSLDEALQVSKMPGCDLVALDDALKTHSERSILGRLRWWRCGSSVD